MDRVDAKAEAKSLVLGGSGLVGGYIVDHLVRAGQRPLALSRSPQTKAGVDWICGDLEKAERLQFPPFATLYCTASAILLPAALPYLLVLFAARRRDAILPGNDRTHLRWLASPRRTVAVPAWLWRAIFLLAKPLFPNANVAMGIHMMKDMTFDASPAEKDFGWNPRRFNPVFEKPEAVVNP